MRIKVPNYAKLKAKKALELRRTLPKSKKFGIDKAEAKRQGIFSGVERAKQLIRSKTISEEDARQIHRFCSRFVGRSSPKIEGAIDLWGGRKFCRYIRGQIKDT